MFLHVRRFIRPDDLLNKSSRWVGNDVFTHRRFIWTIYLDDFKNWFWPGFIHWNWLITLHTSHGNGINPKSSSWTSWKVGRKKMLKMGTRNTTIKLMSSHASLELVQFKRQCLKKGRYTTLEPATKRSQIKLFMKKKIDESKRCYVLIYKLVRNRGVYNIIFYFFSSLHA